MSEADLFSAYQRISHRALTELENCRSKQMNGFSGTAVKFLTTRG